MLSIPLNLLHKEQELWTAWAYLYVFFFLLFLCGAADTSGNMF